ncbi:MAG: endonuclease I family protein, partial [bacterium]
MNFKLKYISLVCFLIVSNSAISQITSSKNSIAFNATNELSIDSVTFYVKNNSTDAIKIDSLVFFKTYSSYAFSSKFNRVTINAKDSAAVKIYFHPKHNILHNSELLIITEPSAYSISIDITGQGKYSKTYYNQTENKTEDALKAALKTTITAGYVSLGYNSARDKMFMEFDNQKINGQGASVNTLECVYTGRKAVGYTDRTDAQNSANFNTEHTFPQGFFNQDEPMRSDLYHLFPTDANANNSRGNFPFGIASTPYQNDATNFPSHLGSNNLYEPRDVHKGNVARAMMYFVIRYSDYANHFAPQENILRAWHNQYTPSEIEKKRNDAIAILQKNRNPFIDYPQFNERITKIIGTSNTLIVPS